MSLELSVSVPLTQMDSVWTPSSWDSPLPQMVSPWTYRTAPLPPPAALPRSRSPSGAARGAASGGAASLGAEPASAEPGGADPEGAEPGGVESEGAESGGAEPEGAEPWGTEPEGAEPGGAESEGAESGGAGPRGSNVGGTGARGAGAASPRGARTSGTGAAGAGGVGGAGAGDPDAGGSGAGDPRARGTGAGGAGAGATRAGGTGGAGAAGPEGAHTRGTGAAGAGGVGGAGAGRSVGGGPGAGGAGAGDPRAGGTGAGGAGAGGAGAGDPGAGGAGAGGAGAGGPSAGAGGPGATGTVQRHPFFVPPETPHCLLPSPYAEQTDSLTERREPESRPASPVHAVCTGRRIPRPRPPPVPGTHVMALHPSSVPLHVPLPSHPVSSLPESTTASALVSELVDFAAACRLDYAASLVAESESGCPPCVGGECALGTDVLEDRQEDIECLAATIPHLVAMLLAPEGDPDAPDIPTPRSYAEAITGPYSSQVKRPPGSPPVFKARYVARGDLAAPPTWLHWVVSCRYRQPVYGLRQAPREWHDTLRTSLAALGFAPLTADPSLFLRTDSSLSRSCRRDTPAQTWVLQRFGFQYSSPQSTPLPTGHSLSAPPSDESVEPSGPYPEFLGCLMYLMTCTRPDLAYPLSIVARYVAPGRHRPEHHEAAKRVLRYLCSTSGMGLVLGGRGPVVLTGSADASWVDDLATERSTQGYTFSLGFGSVSWQPTRSSSVLCSSCEAEIYTRAMAAQELRWLTYLLTDLGERPCSSPVLYVDNKAMIALCQEHRMEHRTKHVTLHYFLAQELQQHGQLRLAYMATRANNADIFTKALQRSYFAFLD
ncbi:unnamed protein product [Closterium sp. NIES-53]